MAYIEIEKAIAEIDKGDLLVGNNAEWAKEILYRTPTADVVEVKHGEYIQKGAWHIECSVCRHVLAHIGEAKNYCPNCGADMRGRRTDER